MHEKSKMAATKWNKELSSLMEFALKDGIRIKSAAEVGRRAVEYFRGIDFCEWVNKNRDILLDKHKTAIGSNKLQTARNIEDLGDALLQHGFIYRAEYKPLDGVTELDDSGKPRRPPKWPKRVAISSKQRFDENGFYVILYEGNKSWHYMMLLLIILIVLSLCMFPAWPLPIKIGVWYLSVFLMLIILILVVGRLLVFTIFWFFGVDFWIFPNLLSEDASILYAYTPIFEFTRRKDDWYMVAARLFGIILVGAAIHQLGKTHSVSDVGAFAKRSFLDVLEWGHQKLGNAPASTEFATIVNKNSKKTTPGDEMDTEELLVHGGAEFISFKRCGYPPIGELIQGCFKSCDCIKEMIQSDCFSLSTLAEERILEEVEAQICFDDKNEKMPFIEDF
ncbi:putative translocation protein sec62 [Cardiosporidium cionae]|uniref:Translocation protein SEC62 n=1 Tax=Cardiosporidium cionae TaxID=476202 RepID=A0ABQ7JC14_9APIC|nr:putative translocation protein sec62 [Cardiosporidium cionae]|eukprot:KAF8821529.1 putative translocation protein sec62 [Cardiosporidium cionae]